MVEHVGWYLQLECLQQKRFPSRLSTGICFCQVWLYFVLVKYCPENMKLCHFSLWEPTVIKDLGSTFRTDWESSTCVLESVWMCAIHRQPAGVKRSGISLATCVTGICGWTVLCIAFQVWGQSRFLMTVVWRTLWNTRALQIHVPAGRDMGGAHCLFQCRYSENISWGQITVMILKDFCFSARPSCCLMQSSHATPLACTLIFPKSRLQYCVC